ncbi:hypothetical protein [Flavobacterium sp.]|jgi:hypothetical protein|uniref:hypothetical protein n=1 Tax=Flavobacterium sp. TaxID=239 RepID=UPI0037BE9AEE
MKKKIVTFIFLLFTVISFSQIRTKDVIGTWYAENELTQSNFNDTIKFYQNPKIIENIKCEFIKWEIEKKTFKLSEVNLCSAKAKVSSILIKEKIEIIKTDFGQIIEYYQDKKVIDKFRIIRLQNNISKEFTVIRFDRLIDQKLYKYVDSLIFKVLKYNPEPDESLTNYGVQIADGNPNFKVTIKEGENRNLEPLIVVNGYLIKNKEILKEILLAETYGITFLTKEKSASLYGYKAVNGVIILQTSEKKFKAIRKKYYW